MTVIDDLVAALATLQAELIGLELDLLTHINLKHDIGKIFKWFLHGITSITLEVDASNQADVDLWNARSTKLDELTVDIGLNLKQIIESLLRNTKLDATNEIKTLLGERTKTLSNFVSTKVEEIIKKQAELTTELYTQAGLTPP